MTQTGKDDIDIADIEALARLLDNRFRIPGTQIRFGLDSLLGLLPIVGDGATATLGLYIIGRSLRLGVPFHIILMMFINLMIDAIVGAIPFLGDMFDLAFRSHAKNVRMLVKHLKKKGYLVDTNANATP